MKSLQDWGLMGEIYIGCGFIRGKLAGIYYDILGRVGGRLAAVVALCKALGARLPGGGQVCSRLSAPRSHRRVKACTARRRGVPFVRTKGTKIRLGLRPKTPTRRYTPPGKPKQRLPGAGLDDAYRVPQAHFM